MKCARAGCSAPVRAAGCRSPKPKFCSDVCYQRQYYGTVTKNKRRTQRRRNLLPDFVVAMAKLKEE